VQWSRAQMSKQVEKIKWIETAGKILAARQKFIYSYDLVILSLELHEIDYYKKDQLLRIRDGFLSACQRNKMYHLEAYVSNYRDQRKCAPKIELISYNYEFIGLTEWMIWERGKFVPLPQYIDHLEIKHRFF